MSTTTFQTASFQFNSFQEDSPSGGEDEEGKPFTRERRKIFTAHMPIFKVFRR